jgi:hypothetical protein
MSDNNQREREWGPIEAPLARKGPARRALDVLLGAGIERHEWLPNGLRCGQHVPSLGFSLGSVGPYQQSDRHGFRHELPEQFQTLWAQGASVKDDA